jgi:heme-degrading monooxygenase HmoA
MKEQRMFASMRRYRLQEGSMEELTRRVDEGFAQEISTQPGFVSYEFIDCGEGEIMTISVFEEAGQVEGSRELAQRWTGERLRDLEFTRIEALNGEIIVSRANEEMLAPAHVSEAGKFASVRRYRLRRGEVSALMHVVDEVFADAIQEMPGFEAYHALDCGPGEILAVSLFRDQASAGESDERALQFVGEQLATVELERTEVIGGEVRVSRAQAQLLLPAHA